MWRKHAKHEHDLQVHDAFSPPRGILAGVMGGGASPAENVTVVLLRCTCGKGAGHLQTVTLEGRWTIEQLKARSGAEVFPCKEAEDRFKDVPVMPSSHTHEPDRYIVSQGSHGGLVATPLTRHRVCCPTDTDQKHDPMCKIGGQFASDPDWLAAQAGYEPVDSYGSYSTWAAKGAYQCTQCFGPSDGPGPCADCRARGSLGLGPSTIRMPSFQGPESAGADDSGRIRTAESAPEADS